MKTYRKTAFGLALLLTIASCSGCSAKDSKENLLNKDDPVTITIWHYYNGVQQENFDQAVSEFNNTIGLEKGIIVEAYSKDTISDLETSVIAAVKKDAGAENPPDIFATYAETAYVLDQMNALADLSDYFTEEELDEYIDGYLEEGKFSKDSGLKIFPTAKSTEVMMINATDWQPFADATGVTTEDLETWEGVTEVAEKYYDYTDALTPDVENDGKAFFGRDSVANYMNIGAMQLGAPFVTADESGEVTITVDEDAVKKLWENYYVPYVKGYFTAQGRYRSEDAKTGAIIALVCSTTGVAYYPTEVTLEDDTVYPIESTILPVPYFEGTDPYMVQQGAGMSVIASDEKTEYASAVFLKWFTEEERNIEFAIGSGYLPVKEEANNVDKVAQVIEDNNIEIDDMLLRSLDEAITDISTRELYTSPPFEDASEFRDVLGDFIQDTADADYAEAKERIDNGEDRASVLEEYTSDEAFTDWFTRFQAEINGVVETE